MASFSNPDSTLSYTILRIPVDTSQLIELSAKFRDTKLAALQAEPTGFAVKFEEEILHPLSLWQQRLSAPSTILVCLAEYGVGKGEGTDEERLLAQEWVGMGTIRGPLTYAMFHLPESGQPIPENPELETRWHFCNLYTSAAHRGRGLAKRLNIAALEYAREQTRALEGGDHMKARIRLFMNPEKVWLVNIYKGMEFKEAGKCTLGEAFVANGDAELVPKDTVSSEELRGKWNRRYGLAMERIVEV
jgi:ribosomal protein S18 acetylase RimI-like enzyme